MSPISPPPGPLNQYAEHLRHLATQLERYRDPAAEISLVWADVDFEAFQADPEATRVLLLRKYFALMNAAGITDRDTQFELIQEILGKRTKRTTPITSRSQLTIAELGRLTQALQDWEIVSSYAP